MPPSSLGTAVGGVDEDADTELGATESDGGVVTLPPETGPRPDDGTRPESVVFEPPNCRQVSASVCRGRGGVQTHSNISHAPII